MQAGAFVLEAAFVLGVVTATDAPRLGFRHSSQCSHAGVWLQTLVSRGSLFFLGQCWGGTIPRAAAPACPASSHKYELEPLAHGLGQREKVKVDTNGPSPEAGPGSLWLPGSPMLGGGQP